MHCLNKLAWSHLLLGLGLISASLSALAADPALVGVWRGTIGKAPVSMCFNSDGGGSYYYFARDAQLSLAYKDSGEWEETPPFAEEPSGALVMHLHENVMRGYWRSPSNNKKIALKLQRVKFNLKDEPCDSVAFHQTRLNHQKISFNAPKKFAGKSFRNLSAGSVTGVEILAPLSANISKINALLRSNFDTTRFIVFQCIGNTQRSASGYYNSEQSIATWSSQWLVVKTLGDYECADVHPDLIYSANIYDLNSGQEIDIKSWFKPGIWEPEYQSLPPESELGILVHKTLSPEDYDSFNFMRLYSVWPSQKGMIFYPLVAYVEKNSAEEILIPYPKLKPYLNAAGLKAVNELMQEYP